MNFLILGDGPEELAWAQALADHPEHRLWAASPGFKSFPDLPGGQDLDEALATAEVEAVVVGGQLEQRPENLRRVAAVGLPAICLHPPGPDADAYYQVSLSRQETGAIVIPDLPGRLHPAIAVLRQALQRRELGALRGIHYEAPVGPQDGELTGEVFPRVVDLVRALLGEIEAVTAAGPAPGERPVENLLVVLRGPNARQAEVRLWRGPFEPARLSVVGERGTLAFEHDPGFLGPAHLVRKSPTEGEMVTELDPWDPKHAILQVLTESRAVPDVHPDLTDGIRSMEITNALLRSVKRERTIDLHYGEVSEASNFKTVMTSTGCVLLLLALAVLPVALVGPAFGLSWTIYIAYVIPPVLVVFMLLQVLRFALKKD
jgi:predicted dehydrogenase